MKSKLLAAKYIESNYDTECLSFVISDFINCLRDQIKDRNITTNESIFKLFDEFDRKWLTFARIVNKKNRMSRPIKNNGFRLIIKEYFAKAYYLYLNYKRNGTKN